MLALYVPSPASELLLVDTSKGPQLTVVIPNLLVQVSWLELQLRTLQVVYLQRAVDELLDYFYGEQSPSSALLPWERRWHPYALLMHENTRCSVLCRRSWLPASTWVGSVLSLGLLNGKSTLHTQRNKHTLQPLLRGRLAKTHARHLALCCLPTVMMAMSLPPRQPRSSPSPESQSNAQASASFAKGRQEQTVQLGAPVQPTFMLLDISMDAPVICVPMSSSR